MNRIRDLRKAKGYSQKELGEKLGVTLQTVSKWEVGERNPDFENLDALSEILEADFNYLLGRSDKNNYKPFDPGEQPLPDEVVEKVWAEQHDQPLDLVKKALDLYARYQIAPENAQGAVDKLLGVDRQPLGFQESPGGKQEQN